MLLPCSFLAFRRALGAGALALASGGCLPGDERPPPGVVSVWVEGAGGLEGRTPIATVDGWLIAFDRVLVTSSGVNELVDDAATPEGATPRCTVYYDTEMRAIYDLVVPGPRLLGHFGGVGACEFDASWGRLGLSPDVLGPGVSGDDVRAIAAAAIAAGGRGVPALYVAGVATKGARQKSFAWPFSPRFVSGGCGLGRGVLAFRRHVNAGAALDAVVTVHPEWLFADAADTTNALLRFDPLADADDRGDGDGAVTRAELEQRPLDGLVAGDVYAWPALRPPPTDVVGVARQPTLLDFVNLQTGHAFYNDGRDPCARPDPPE